MSTTTIRMPEEIKTRVAAAVKRSGTTAHGFILEAIAEKVAREEMRSDFNAAADERFATLVASGKTVPWQDMRAYLEARLAGETVERPAAKKFAL
jgi:predicted transcriptional regulator